MEKTKIAHAIRNEKGSYTGGKKGDQTKKEILIQEWYLHVKGWIVIRAKDPEVREKLAQAMEMICANDNFGYGQDYRLSGFNEAKKVGFDPSKVKVKCGLDCSQSVRVALHYAGIKCENFRTRTMRKVLEATGKFEILTSDKYCKSSDYLLRGDILLTAKVPGHTAVNLTDGAKIKEQNIIKNEEQDTKKETSNTKYNKDKVKVAKYYSKSLAGTYKTTTALNLRYGAGATQSKILTIPKGEKVKCYGYYNKVLKTKWYLVEFDGYVGYCSSKYLKK